MNKVYFKSSRLFLFVLFLGMMLEGGAQSITNYQFSTNNTSSLNRTFGSLIDDIDMSSSTTLLFSGSVPPTTTAHTTSTVAMPFDFFVNGSRYGNAANSLYVSTNGWVFLNFSAATTPFNQTTNYTGARLTAFQGSDMSTSGWGRVHYKVVGSQPNRVMVIEYLNMTMPHNAITYDTNTFQVRLYENNGGIEFVYGRMLLNGSSSRSYNTGIHMGNGATVSPYYQHVNTTTHTASTSINTANTYSPGEITSLSGRTPGSQRAYMWTPVPPDDVTPLTITNITSTSMRLNFTNPTNELGFMLYSSTDGINYSPYSQFTTAGTVFTATGLIANTTYYWRLYSYRESLSGSADASATTLPASKFFTVASGNWNDGSIWNTTTVPGSQDSAEISVGHSVTLNQVTQSCGTLIVKGTLQYWNNNALQYMIANGDVIVETGGNFNAGASSGSGTQNLYLYIGGNSPTASISGSLIVNGTLDLQTTNNVQTTFYGNQDATVSGTGATCELPFITCYKGTDTTVMLEFLRTYTQSSSTPTQTNSQRLTVTAGTLKISAPVVTNSFFNATTQLAYSAVTTNSSRLWLNHSGINMGVVPALTTGANPFLLRGELRIDAGTLTTGVGNGTFSLSQGATLRLNGGTLTHYGAVSSLNTTPVPSLIVAGGDLNIDPQGTVNFTGTTTPLLNIVNTSNFTFSAGNITIIDPHATSITSTLSNISIQIVAGGNKSITGGTFRIGNNSSTSAGAAVSTYSGFGLSIGIPVYNITFSNLGVTNTTRYCRLISDLTVLNRMTIDNNGYLTTGKSDVGFSIYQNGDVINNGLLTAVIPGNTTPLGNINFVGTIAQTVTGTGTASYLTSRIANPAGVVFNNTGKWTLQKITLETGNVTNTTANMQVGSTAPAYTGTIAIGGLNETTTAGAFSAIPTIQGSPIYIYGPAANTLTTGSFNEMVAGAQTLTGLTVNDLQGLTANRNITIPGGGTLALTEGNLKMGNNALSLGSSAVSAGTLTRTNGYVVLGSTGTFTRWFPAGFYNFTYASGFPLSTGNYDRSVLFSGFLSTGGQLTIKHDNVLGYTDIAPGFNEPVKSITIDRRSNSSWTISGTVPTISGTLTMRVLATGIGAITNYDKLALVTTTGNLAGTTVANTGDNTNPEINKTQSTFTFNSIMNTQFYVGTNSGINPLSPTITAINTGNWNDVNTWEAGIIPTITNNAIIAPGVTVTVPASYIATCNGLTVSAGATVLGVAGSLNNAGSMILDGTFTNSGTNVNIIGTSSSGITINSGGTLNISAGTISVGPTGGGNRKLLVSGTLGVSGGTLNINGNLEVAGGATFNQSAGDINIDGNDGTSSGSTAASEHLLYFSGLSTATNIACSGGTITIVDPPYQNSTFALRIQLNAGSLTAFTGTHTLRLGDGVSTTTSANPNGFVIDTKRGSGRVPLQNLIVNAGNGVGRWVSDATSSSGATHVKGNVTINANSELRHTTTAANFAIGGNITNNGIMTMAAPLILGGEGYLVNNAQTIDGTGTFRNSTTSSTGAFTALKVDNGTGLTLNTTNTTFGVTGLLTLGTAGDLKISTNSNTIVMGSAGSISRTSGYIVGNLGKTLPAGTANYTFEIGTATNYLPVEISNIAVSTSGVLAFGTTSGAHPQLGSSCINAAKMINRYWKVSRTGLVSTGGDYKFNFVTGEALGSVNLALAKTFAYNGSAWTGGVTGSGSTSSYTVTGLSLSGDIAVGEISPKTPMVSISATPSGAICAGTSVLFSASAITWGGDAPTYKWKVNGIQVATTSTYSSSTLNNNDQVTLEIVSNDACVLPASATVSSAAITITVNQPTVAGDVTGGTTICSGSTSGLLSLSGQTGSVQRWQYSVAPFSVWNDTAVVTTSFTSAALTQTTRFRAAVKNGACAEAFSDTTEVIVTPPSAAPTITGNTSVCSGANAGNLTLPVVGTVGTILRWETATNSAFTLNFNSTPSASNTFAAGSPSQTTYYRAIVKNGTCQADTSPTHTVTVLAASAGGTPSNNSQTICAGGSVLGFTLSGSVGTVIKWQSSSDLGFTTPKDTAITTITYTPPSPTATTYYRAVVQSSTCNPANSGIATVTVNPAPGGGTISGSATVCSGTSPSILTLQGTPVGTIVRWESQTAATAPAWTPILNTNATYNPGILTVTTKFRVVLSNSPCPDGFSAEKTITVDPVSVGGTVSSPTSSVCTGSPSGLLTADATGRTGNVVNWLYATAPFTTYTAVSPVSATNTYTSGNLTATTRFRALVQSGSCSTDTSSFFVVTVNPAPSGGTINGATAVCTGTSPGLLELTGTYTGTIANWQFQDATNAPAWTDIATATGSQYTPGNITANTKYRVKLVSAGCSDGFSGEKSVTVSSAPIAGAVTSTTTSVCSGTSGVSLSLTGSTGTIQNWLIKTAPATTYSIVSPSNTTTSLTTGAITAQTSYRVLVSNGACGADTATAHTIAIAPASVGGTLNGSQTICAGGSVSALTLQTGSYQGTIQGWESSTSSSFTTSTPISGVTSDTYTPSSAPSVTTYYRVVVKNGSCDQEYSSVASITVNSTATAGTLSNTGATSICFGTTGPGLQLSGYSGTIQKWEVAYAPAFTYTDITGQTTANYATGSLNRTARYRVTVNNTGCAAVLSNEVTVTVDSASLAGAATTATTSICTGTAPAQLSLTGTIRGTVTRWDSSATSPYTTFAPIPSSAGNTYTSPALTATTHFLAVVQNGVCPEATSTAVAVSVSPGVVAGAIGGTSAVCGSPASALLNLTGNTATASGWLESTSPFTTYLPISGSAGQNSITPSLSATTRYKAFVTNSTCPNDTTPYFEVTVQSGGIWIGASSNAWSNASNWCGGVPTSTTDVVIRTGTLFSPAINAAAVAKSVTIDAGATMSFSGTGNSLTLSGDLTVNGTFTTTGGTVIYNSTSAQNVAGITYNNLVMNGTGAKNLTGNATVAGDLTLSSGLLNLGSNNLNLTGTLSGGSGLSYINTNGTGSVKHNISAAAFTFPVGSGSYTPLVISNSGTADNISVNILPNCYNSYSGFTGLTLMSGQKVVNRTFIITEDVAGGSNLNIEFNWSASDEQATMDKTKMVVGHYTSTWNHATASAQDITSSPFKMNLNNQSTLGIFGVGDETSPLPVRLLSFTAKLNRNVTHLNWVTASETNNSHFEVERGTDGYNFETIGDVAGKGNSGGRIDYTHDDTEAGKMLEYSNILYYRLKQFNFSGEFEYSPVISVSSLKAVKFDVVSTVPNPFSTSAVVTYKTSATTKVDVVVTDAFGKLISTSSVIPVLGSNKVEIGADNQWKAGVYFVKLTQDNVSKVVKIVRQ